MTSTMILLLPAQDRGSSCQSSWRFWRVLCQRRTTPVYDILIAGGEVYDGSGGAPVKTDVAISGIDCQDRSVRDAR
jgi:hypothetical protein